MAGVPTPNHDLPDDLDADLIAYLDGELDDPEARLVEAQLARDPAARTRADAYKKTYDLLDYLPRPEPSPDFAARTLTRLHPAKSDERQPPHARGARPGRRSAIIPWLVAGVLAGIGGYVAHAAVGSAAGGPSGLDELSYADVRVIENLPLYLGVDDLDYLHSLDAANLFAPEQPVAAREPQRLDVPPANRDRLEVLYAAYPHTRREQLRTLDQQLRNLPPLERDHLVRVLEGYATWLDRLSDAERGEVLAAPSGESRLTAVRLVKERAWRDALPVRARDMLKHVASDQERLGMVEERKAAEHARREEWQLARRQWDDLRPDRKPWPFSDERLTGDVERYVTDVLKVDLKNRPDGKADYPASWRMTQAEYADLRARHLAAVNKGGGWEWFSYGLYVHRLSERHPYLPPFAEREPVTDPSALPAALIRDLRRGGLQLGERRWVRGKWPEFALEVDAAAKRAGVKLPVLLGPARPHEFAPEVGAVLMDLHTRLTPVERERLAKLEGRWPEYPRTFLTLAARHDLPVPGVTLPGRPSLWARYYSLAPHKK